MKINRLEMLKANIGLEQLKGASKLERFFYKILNRRALKEYERQAGILGKSVRDNAKLAHAVVNASFRGMNFSDRIWTNSATMWDESIAVGQLQRDLRAMAYEDQNGNTLAIDDIYGPATEYAVKRLQSFHGLVVDGIYGPLSDGALMKEIRVVQNALIKVGYNIQADGAVGQQTDLAIRDFQAKHGLVVDGIVGQQTLAKLGIA